MRTIASLIYPDVMSLDVTGPLQVFASANVELRRLGQAEAYRLRVLGEQAGPVATSAGFQLVAEQAWRRLRSGRAGHPAGARRPGRDGAVRQPAAAGLAARCRAAGPSPRLGISGALILAGARVCSTGAARPPTGPTRAALRQHPAIEVDGDRLHPYDPSGRDGDAHVFTLAGVTTGIDLALALVEADIGRPLALAVARRLVMFLRRPGGQAQFGALLAPDASRTPRLLGLLEWMAQNLAADLSLEALAQRAHLSSRSLSRLFVQELGMGPGRYVEQLRLEAARGLLQDSGASIGTVARLTGFRHPENLRRTFHKHLSVSPQDYAERFA